VLAACVTEHPSSRARTSQSRAQTADNDPGAKPRLPDGPIATPAGTSRTARLNCRLLPLGLVPYDGQVLPLISPDGLFMAIEQGDAPGWPALLAQPDAAPSPGTRIASFDLRQPPMTELPPNDPAPRGSILGRSCDTRGYLVEWPRPDGSRWIGRLGWVAGKIEWLTQGTDVSAHAVLSHDGTLAYTRRTATAGARPSLIVRHPDGGEIEFSPQDGACAFPVFAPGGRVVCTLVLSASGIDLVALRCRHADGARATAFGAPLSRRTLSTVADLTAAYQAFAGASATMSDDSKEPTGAAEATLFFSPRTGRMSAFWWRDGTIVPLADHSIAAAHSSLIDPPGFFQTTPEGLMFSALPKDLNTPMVPVRLMEASYVPRATSNTDRPIILIGPASKRDPTRLSIVAMSMLPPDAPQ